MELAPIIYFTKTFSLPDATKPPPILPALPVAKRGMGLWLACEPVAVCRLTRAEWAREAWLWIPQSRGARSPHLMCVLEGLLDSMQ